MVSVLCLFLLLFAVLFVVGFAYPSNTFQCSRYCKEDWNKFGYEIGSSYEYSYTGDVRSFVNATDANGKNQETGLILTANVILSVVSNCDFILKVSGNLKERYADKSNKVIITRPSLDDDFSAALNAHSLYFSFQNGRIETICPSDEEQSDILNVKKAILSAFQNSMPNLEEDATVYETDVSGNCETQYKINKGHLIKDIEKTKNLEACSHRKNKHLSWLSVPYSKTTTKTQSLLRSTQSCNQIFNNKNVLESVECDELHLFQPFSNNENAAKALIKQKMKLLSISSKMGSSEFPTSYHHESLIPVYNKDEKNPPSLESVANLLRKLDANTAEGVEKEVPRLFLQLVNYIRELDFDNVEELFEMVRDFPRQKKILLDAMPLVTTLDGIRVIKELYKNGEINENQLNSWLTSFAFIKTPTVPIINALAPMMKQENKRIGQKVVLILSTLIYMYCKEDQRCIKNPDILKTIRMIEEPLATKCVPTSEEVQDRIILALKAIGNMGIMGLSTSFNNLRMCYSNNDIPIEIQLAAIAAHRRVNCAENTNLDELLDYFADPRQPNEIRIASYLASMQCASYTTFTRIRDVLRTEETNQVGSFVWTHLTNLQETSSRWKQNLRSLVENEFLRNKFSTDMRKYSRNYETSMYFDAINAGGTVESNVIFTSESYLPKSMMLNLTLDLFGEAVNLFEIGGRIEGFEQAVENLFGPEGYFPEETIKRLLEDVRGQNNNHGKMEELGNTFVSQNTLKKNPSGMWYAKVFGNELSYARFNDLESFIGGPINTENILKAIMNIFREQDVNYSKSFLFFDSACQVPTLLGFPLQLTANGVATVGFTVKGQLDVKDLWSRKFMVEGKVYPSSSVEVTASLTIDGIITKTGLKSVYTLNSNTYLDGHIFVDDGKIVDLKLNVPKEEMNIINVESAVYLFQNETDIEMEDVSKNVEKLLSCTPKSISTIVGFEVCQDLKYVNASMDASAPFFPLTGRFTYSLDIKKTDLFDSYVLLFKVQTIVNKYRPLYSMSFYLDTPNSIVNRKINATYQLDFENLSLKAELTSPFANLKIMSKVGDDYDKLNFILQTLFNNREIIYLKTALKSSNVNNAWRYQPLLKLNYKEKQIVSVSGSVDYIQGSEYKSNLKIDCLHYDTIAITGTFFQHDDKYSMSASIHSREMNGNVLGEVMIKLNRINVTTAANYNFNQLKNQQLLFNVQGHRIANVNVSEDFLHLKLYATQKPLYNSELLISSYRKHMFMKNNGILSLFGITWNTEQLFKFHKRNEYYDIALKCDLTCKQKPVDYKIALVHNASAELFLVHGLLQLNRMKRIELLTHYNRILDQNQTLRFLFYYPRQAWILNGTITQEKYNEHEFVFNGYRECDDQRIPLILISGSYSNVTTSDSEHYKINGTLEIPDNNGRLYTPWKITSVVQIADDKFVNINNLETTGDATYISHISWSPESVSCVLQVNAKQILVVNGIKKQNEITALLSFNIYQHFEWSMAVILPYKKFQMALYWDKDRDCDQRMTLFFVGNAPKGLYNAVVEYPNQKITVALLFLYII